MAASVWPLMLNPSIEHLSLRNGDIENITLSSRELHQDGSLTLHINLNQGKTSLLEVEIARQSSLKHLVLFNVEKLSSLKILPLGQVQTLELAFNQSSPECHASFLANVEQTLP